MRQMKHGTTVKNKTNFVLPGIALAVFILSALCGYYGPGLYHAWRMERARDSFAAPLMPREIVDEFTASFKSVRAHDAFTPFPALSAVSGEGKPLDLAGRRDRPLLLNLWATWCAPCVVELPSLESLARTYDERMDVMAVSIDIGKTSADIDAFLQKHKIGAFAGWLDGTGGFTKKLGIRGVPVSFLIGTDGGILYVFEGDADWDGSESRSFFNAFLQNQ